MIFLVDFRGNEEDGRALLALLRGLKVELEEPEILVDGMVPLPPEEQETEELTELASWTTDERTKKFHTLIHPRLRGIKVWCNHQAGGTGPNFFKFWPFSIWIAEVTEKIPENAEINFKCIFQRIY